MQTKKQDNAGVIAPPPFIYLGGLILGLFIQKQLPFRLSWRKRRPFLGTLLITAGFMLGFTSFRTMRGAGTTPDPRQPVTTIVTSGPFQLSRNPIYLSMALMYSGIAVLTNALWPMLLLPFVLGIMNRGVIDREERYLERKFGERYMEYKQSVRRWL